jgi:phosphoribosyl-AMP cyclohydrolase
MRNARRLNTEQVRFDDRGLVPAIIQDALDGRVLMMAWMNAESLALSLESGSTVFWSRSRQELWAKGATSGNVQVIESVSMDCDGDTLLFQVQQVGNGACHTGARSCFDVPPEVEA